MKRRAFLKLGAYGLSAGVFPCLAASYADTITDGELHHSPFIFTETRKGTVAFLGGSITEMEGYRPRVCSLLQKRFPETAFTFTAAGVSSTCSTTGAFRFSADILEKGTPDLLFVEFAVNDDQDAHHTHEECIRGMEGILRHARKVNPFMDIVMTLFVNENMLAQTQEGKLSLPYAAHRKVAAHYGVPVILLGNELARQIKAGSFTWKKYGGVHPAPAGNDLCADMIRELFRRKWQSGKTEKSPYPFPVPLDPFSYENGHFVDFAQARSISGWTLGEPNWKKAPGGKRDRFLKQPFFYSEAPGSIMELDFSGTAVGAFLLAGPDAGMVEATVDGKSLGSFNLYHAYSQCLQYPRTILFSDTLPAGAHKLQLRILSGHDKRAIGTACRVYHFVANG